MKLDQKFEVGFISILVILFIGLVAVCMSKNDYNGLSFYPGEIPTPNDYNIIDKSEACNETTISDIYRDDDYIYYLTCKDSSKIYLEWNNGEVNLLEKDLENGRVTINSLIEHGLNVERRSNNED